MKDVRLAALRRFARAITISAADDLHGQAACSVSGLMASHAIRHNAQQTCRAGIRKFHRMQKPASVFIDGSQASLVRE